MINENMRTLVYDVVRRHGHVSDSESRTAALVNEVVHLYDIVITEYVRGVQKRLDADWRSALAAIDDSPIPAQRRMLAERAQNLVTYLRESECEDARTR